jgi:hypothetical protein
MSVVFEMILRNSRQETLWIVMYRVFQVFMSVQDYISEVIPCQNWHMNVGLIFTVTELEHLKLKNDLCITELLSWTSSCIV